MSCASDHWAVDPSTGCYGCDCLEDVRIRSGGKGWGVTGWPEADGWHFSIVNATNRIKSCDEVVNDTNLPSSAGTPFRVAAPHLTALKSGLARVLPSEYITFCNGGCPDVDCRQPTPPAAMTEELTRYAQALGLNWHVLQR
jgi:hypothetical protein